MALVLKDRVKETSTTTGTGTFTLAGAATGFQSFSVIGNSNTVYYAIVRNGYDEWEIGIGTYTSSGTTLSRDTVLESSNSGSKVNFSAGTKEVFCTYPAEKAVTIDDVQTLSNKTLASPSVTGSITFSDSSTQNTAATGFGFKNRIINGAMGIWQRGTSFSGTVYAADRWQCAFGTGVTTSQSSDVPSSAFQYSISLDGSNFPTLAQRIESKNSFDLVGQSVTVSFWLKQSSGAGANSIGLQLYYPTASDNYASQTQIGSTVNISATSSWVQYTATFSSLPSGVANGLALQIYSNAAGSATYLVTGVQLEKGSTATSFDYRPYGTELALCQRYYSRGSYYCVLPVGASGVTRRDRIQLPVPMRATTLTFDDGGGNSGKVYRNGGNQSASVFNYTNIAVALNVTTGGAASGDDLFFNWFCGGEL